jgi:hypothetical protein
MITTYTGKLGLFRLKQTFSSGRVLSVSRGRLHISQDALTAIDMRIGDRYSFKKGEKAGQVIFKKSTSPTAVTVKAPVSIGFESTFTLDFAGSSAGISAQELDLTDIIFEVHGQRLIGQLPETVKFNYFQSRRERWKAGGYDWRDAIRGYKGAAAAIALESHRYDNGDTPVEVDQLLSLLRDEGHRVEQLSERLWRLDGKTSTLGDLLDLARKYQEDVVLVAA